LRVERARRRIVALVAELQRGRPLAHGNDKDPR
jgi:hypothetical protein